MERMTVKRDDGRWALANNDSARPMEQMEKIPFAIALLAAYEDTGLTPGEIMVMCSMDRRAKMVELLRMEGNKPLTSDELLKMDGTPVWITKMDGSGGVWMLVDAEYKLCREAHGEMAVFENCGKTWTACRHKMEPDEIRSLLQTDAPGRCGGGLGGDGKGGNDQ